MVFENFEMVFYRHNNILKDIFEQHVFPDIKFCFSDGDFLFAHQAILAMNSEFFKKFLKYIPETSETLKTLILPDISKNIMQKILHYLYTGEVQLNLEEIASFIETKIFFGINDEISHKCIIGDEKHNETSIFEPSDLHKDLHKDIHDKKPIKKKYLKENYRKRKVEYKDACQIQPTENLFPRDSQIMNYKLCEVQSENSRNSSVYNLECDSLEENNHNDSVDCYDYTLKNPKCFSVDEIEIDEITRNSEQTCNFEGNEENNIMEQRKILVEEAVKQILENGVSITSASKNFNIPKTLLWRKVKNDPEYKIKSEKLFGKRNTKEILSELCDRLKNGEKLINISKILRVPLSTLHWYKKRLLTAGLLPENFMSTRQTLRNDSRKKKSLEKAIEACKRGMVQNKAAIRFNVSKATLSRRMKNLMQNE
ncbi:uncharacterized protein LOC129607287 [Condylostylus longicornis]|uniref:uncharacterized protein LOC129607287 n=1 Tax=Condylostylus longicornis TaxID=2530218 RepID=UPI00244E2E4F|nr:uncharacterized protein LOC129607287 [Condylostylus longicornis]